MSLTVQQAHQLLETWLLVLGGEQPLKPGDSLDVELEGRPYVRGPYRTLVLDERAQPVALGVGDVTYPWHAVVSVRRAGAQPAKYAGC